MKHIPAIEPTLNDQVDRPPPRVLIVDDDPAVQFAYCRLFEREGVCVDSCDCLAEAHRHIISTPYLAVVTDLQLAGSENTNGLEVIRMVMSKCPGTTVVLSSGFGSDELEMSARNLGAAHYFEKPVNPALIVDTLKSLIPPVAYKNGDV
jgi:DNA-binding NtrC family response regulator